MVVTVRMVLRLEMKFSRLTKKAVSRMARRGSSVSAEPLAKGTYTEPSQTRHGVGGLFETCA